MEKQISDVLINIDKQFEYLNKLKSYNGRDYDYIFRFKLYLDNRNYSILLCVPRLWEQKLFDFYMEAFELLPYFPHLETGGKLCLVELEGILIETDIVGLLNQCIEKVKSVISDGMSGTNRQDFITEFSSYWAYLAKFNHVRSMVELGSEVKKIHYKEVSHYEKTNPYKKADRLTSKFYCADKSSYLRAYITQAETLQSGYYVFVETDHYIYPPDWRVEFDINFLSDIFNSGSFNKKRFKRYMLDYKKDSLLIIVIKQPDDTICVIGFSIFNFQLTYSDEVFSLNDDAIVLPCNVRRVDEEYLLNRTRNDNNKRSKKILLIGAGSIGSYLFGEMIKIGFRDITIVDDDYLYEDNFYRHLLGQEYFGHYKVVALSNWASKNYPYANVITYPEKLEYLLSDRELALNDYDIVISAVGNHNFNRYLNKYIYSVSYENPVLYLWNEVYGIGNHIAVISSRNKGCYNCIFDYSGKEMYDRTSFCERGNVYTRQMVGCGTSFMPYGSSNTLVVVSKAIEELIRCNFNDFRENYIVSLKADDTYFLSTGYTTSKRYKNQSEYTQIVNGNQFYNNKCMICR